MQLVGKFKIIQFVNVLYVNNWLLFLDKEGYEVMDRLDRVSAS